MFRMQDLSLDLGRIGEAVVKTLDPCKKRETKLRSPEEVISRGHESGGCLISRRIGDTAHS